MRTKQTACGSKSQCPKGMATATFPRGTDADPEQQQSQVAGGDTEDSKDWLDVLEEPTQGVASTGKLKVRQVTKPSRLKEEHRHLSKKFHQHQNPVIQNQVPAKTPLMPQLRLTLRTPPNPPPGSKAAHYPKPQ